jgi:hypothetical protein
MYFVSKSPHERAIDGCRKTLGMGDKLDKCNPSEGG